MRIWPALLLLVPLTASADFSPGGRSQRAPTSRPKAVKPKPPTSPEASTGDLTAARMAHLHRRFLADPFDAFSLERLLELARQDPGGVDRLTQGIESDAQSGAPLALAANATLYRATGRLAEARTLLEQVATLLPADPRPRLALADLELAAKNTPTAAAWLGRAAAVQPRAAKEATLRKQLELLATFASSEDARAVRAELVRATGESVAAWLEWPALLAAASRHEDSLADLRLLGERFRGDRVGKTSVARATVTALLALQRFDEAVAVFAQLLPQVPTGVRRELWAQAATAHRGAGRLPELIALLRAEQDASAQRLLVSLLEETGQLEPALVVLQKLGARAGGTLDLARQRARLLIQTGKLDEALVVLEGAAQRHPTVTSLRFELIDAQINVGRTEEAKTSLVHLERAALSDRDLAARVIEQWDRLGEHQRAATLTGKIAERFPLDFQAQADVGSRLHLAGQTEQAIALWMRAYERERDKERAAPLYAEILERHGLLEQAVRVLKGALDHAPTNRPLARQTAKILERAAAGHPMGRAWIAEAISLWKKELEAEPVDSAGLPIARLVQLWNVSGSLRSVTQSLSLAFDKRPDPKLGLLLSAALQAQKRWSDALVVQQRVALLLPHSVQIQVGLERCYARAGDRKGAMRVIETLLRLEPGRSSDHYAKLAEHALELYQDDDALRYAELSASHASTSDAQKHEHLAEMYLQKGRHQEAMASLERALSTEGPSARAELRMGELLLTTGAPANASKHLERALLQGSSLEALRAGELLMEIHRGSRTLDTFERTLTRAALDQPKRKDLLRLLLRVFDDLATGNVDEGRAQRAAATLSQALFDPELAESAMRLAGILQSRPMVAPLLALAGTDSESAVRRARALEALARIPGDESTSGMLAVAEGRGPETLRTMAAWALATRKAPALRRLLDSPIAQVRAWAIAGLGDAAVEDAASAVLAPASRGLQLAALGILYRAEGPSLMRLAPAARAALVEHLCSQATRPEALTCARLMVADPTLGPTGQAGLTRLVLSTPSFSTHFMDAAGILGGATAALPMPTVGDGYVDVTAWAAESWRTLDVPMGALTPLISALADVSRAPTLRQRELAARSLTGLFALQPPPAASELRTVALHLGRSLLTAASDEAVHLGLQLIASAAPEELASAIESAPSLSNHQRAQMLTTLPLPSAVLCRWGQSPTGAALRVLIDAQLAQRGEQCDPAR